MACNGHNHPKDCRCNFRGGHPNSRPPSFPGWNRRTAKRLISRPNAICPECRTSVYYVRGPHGGGAYFDCFGPPWTKHPCTNRSQPYSPYGRTGKPKLRNRRSEFERDGWLPFLIRNIEKWGAGTIIHGVALDDPTVLHFATTNSDLEIDRERPCYFRAKAPDAGRVEFNYFPERTHEPVSVSLHDDCKYPFDLLLKIGQRG